MKNKKAMMAKYLITIILIIGVVAVVLFFVIKISPGAEAKSEYGIGMLKSLAGKAGPSLRDSFAIVVYKGNDKSENDGFGLRYKGFDGVEWTYWDAGKYNTLEKRTAVAGTLDENGIALAAANLDLEGGIDFLFVYRLKDKLVYRTWDAFTDSWSSRQDYPLTEGDKAKNAVALASADNDGDEIDDRIYITYCAANGNLYYNYFRGGGLGLNNKFITSGVSCDNDHVIEVIAADIDGDESATDETVLVFYQKGNSLYYYSVSEDESKLVADPVKLISVTKGNIDADKAEEIFLVYKDTGNQIYSKIYEKLSESAIGWQGSNSITDTKVGNSLSVVTANLNEDDNSEVMIVFKKKDTTNLFYSIYDENTLSTPVKFENNSEKATIISGNFDEDETDEVMAITKVSDDLYGIIYNDGSWINRGKCGDGSNYCIENTGATRTYEAVYVPIMVEEEE